MTTLQVMEVASLQAIQPHTINPTTTTIKLRPMASWAPLVPPLVQAVTPSTTQASILQATLSHPNQKM